MDFKRVRQVLAWRKTMDEINPEISWKRLAQSGDGFLRCSDGVTRWGLYGAAGILFVYMADEPWFFLTERGATEEPGTWGIPGGALDGGEDPEVGALREVQEELELSPEIIREIGRYAFQPCPEWAYTTIMYEVAAPFEFTNPNWEITDGKWFTKDQILSGQYPIHPAFLKTFQAGHLKFAYYEKLHNELLERFSGVRWRIDQKLSRMDNPAAHKFVILNNKHIVVEKKPFNWFTGMGEHHSGLLFRGVKEFGIDPKTGIKAMNEGGYMVEGGDIWGTTVNPGDVITYGKPSPAEMLLLKHTFPELKRIVWSEMGTDKDVEEPLAEVLEALEY